MSLIVETGTGDPTAESYASVADADLYHVNRGNAAWAAATPGAKEQALRKATDYMQQAYGQRWAGVRATASQALDWPRYGEDANGVYFAGDSIPIDVVRACCELALRALSASLSPDVGPRVLGKTIGPISIQYAPGTRQSNAFPAVNGMLRSLLTGGDGQIKLIRA